MKKISSEIKATNDLFNIKIGTTDKKNPRTAYVEIGAYIMPTVEMQFTDTIRHIEHKILNKIVSSLSTNPNYNNDFIFVSDIPCDRMEMNKRSYMELQISLSLSDKMLKQSNNNFKTIAVAINSDCNKMSAYINETLNENNFECFKCKR